MITSPAASATSTASLVDAYRARSLIEEFFKAIKTGCHYEHLQFQTVHALQNALALCFALSWQLLLLRTMGRDAPRTLSLSQSSLTQLQVALLTTLAATSNP